MYFDETERLRVDGQRQREGCDKFLPNNHITDPNEEGKKHDHINNVEASSSKFIKQGLFLFLFLFAHALKSRG